MEETTAKEGYQTIKTKGGFSALLVNNQIIRKSSAPHRLTEDEETYEEYKVRRKLINQLEKEKKPNVFWLSKFNIGGQNYTSQYIKKNVEKAKQNLKNNESTK